MYDDFSTRTGNQGEVLSPRRSARSLRWFAATKDFGLPHDLLHQARVRLRRLAALGALLVGAGVLANVLVGVEFSDRTYPFHLTNLFLCTAMYLAARVGKVPNGLALNLGLLFEVLVCLVNSIGVIWARMENHGHLPYLTWTCIIVVAFPLIIPSPPRKTLVTAVAAAATVPLSLFLLENLGVIEVPPVKYIGISISPAMCVAMAVIGSRVVHGLNVGLADAREMGRYRLVERLGEGGMGEVWRATHQMLARPAAVKIIRPVTDAGDQEVMLERFQREARSTASLTSEHTIRIYDYGVTGEATFYYAMELLRGLDLQQMITRFGPIPPERAVHFLIQACESLAEAHRAGLIHRDIKPSNLFVSRNGLVPDFIKVLDFGLVKDLAQKEEDLELTQKGEITGTPFYVAPEMAEEDRVVDHRADIYSLGCVAYWLLSGKPVFVAESFLFLMMKHVKDDPEPLSQSAEQEIPAELDSLVLSCLSKEPGNRPDSAEVLAQRLSGIPLANSWNRERARSWWVEKVPEVLE